MRYDIGVYQPIFSEETNQELAQNSEDNQNSFWFIAVQALAKLYRRDYLIADHLTNLLINETLVVQMIERDNRYGTNFHRYGYSEELAYQICKEMQAVLPFCHSAKDGTFLYIADKLFRAAKTYDRLSAAANPAYEKRCACFYALWHCYDSYSEETIPAKNSEFTETIPVKNSESTV